MAGDVGGAALEIAQPVSHPHGEQPLHQPPRLSRRAAAFREAALRIAGARGGSRDVSAVIGSAVVGSAVVGNLMVDSAVVGSAVVGSAMVGNAEPWHNRPQAWSHDRWRPQDLNDGGWSMSVLGAKPPSPSVAVEGRRHSKPYLQVAARDVLVRLHLVAIWVRKGRMTHLHAQGGRRGEHMHARGGGSEKGG